MEPSEGGEETRRVSGENRDKPLRVRALEKSCQPVTLTTLQDGGAFAVVHEADGTGHEAGTGGTLGVILLPLTPQAWRGGTTLGAGHTPAGRTAEVTPPRFTTEVGFDGSPPAAQ